jgi:hypothetical protein
MRERDRGPETFEVIEEVEIVHIVETPADGAAGERGAEAGVEDDPLIDVDPGDEDGLPDGPAKYRVPS